MLYRIAKRAYSWRNCVDLLCMHGIIKTGDDLRFDDINIDEDEMNEMLEDL